MSLFSTEQISKYHPDKYADQISDAVVTECIRQDKHSKVACETLVKGNVVVLAGEITTKAKPNYEAIVKKVADKLGYQVDKVINLISEQSPQINQAVVKNGEMGAGDNGIMFGYATRETESRLPYGFDHANKVIAAIESVVQEGILKGDAKTQVTLDTATNDIKAVVINACHDDKYSHEDIQKYILSVLKKEGLFVGTAEYHINTAGRWTIGGAEADAGVTGRKIVADQYGGYVAVGGGAFSGKDPTKVDRTASYFARKLAVDLLEKFNLEECEVQIGFAIGQTKPISLFIKADTHINLYEYVNNNYDLTVKGMINHLDLYNRNYEEIAEGCHYRFEWW